jgi:hypothetical protein
MTFMTDAELYYLMHHCFLDEWITVEELEAVWDCVPVGGHKCYVCD